MSCRVVAHVPSGAHACARSPAASTSNPAEVSRVRGQAAFALPGAFRRDCSQRKLHPDPIGSDTCCRRARRDAGWRGQRRRAQTRSIRAPMTSPPGGPACARPRQTPDFVGRPAGPEASSRSSSGSLDELASPPGKVTAFATTTGARAASRAPPRRETRSAAPEVPSIDVLPHSRSGLSPALDPGLGSYPHVVPNLWSIAAGAFAFRAYPTAA
jgi:hypothetical protein